MNGCGVLLAMAKIIKNVKNVELLGSMNFAQSLIENSGPSMFIDVSPPLLETEALYNLAQVSSFGHTPYAYLGLLIYSYPVTSRYVFTQHILDWMDEQDNNMLPLSNIDGILKYEPNAQLRGVTNIGVVV